VDGEKEELLASLKETGLPLLPCRFERSVTIDKQQWMFLSDWCLPSWHLINQELERILLALEHAVDFDRPLPEASPLWEYMRFEPFNAQNARRAMPHAR